MGPSRASAYTADPDYWKGTAERRDTVSRLVYSQSPQTIPSAYDPVREAEEILRQQQRALPASNPKSPAIWTQLRTLTVKSALSSAPRAMGYIGLGVGVFELGWQIGTGINAKFLRFGLPDPPPAKATTANGKLTFRPAGYSSAFNTTPLPEDGWLLSYQAGNQTWTSVNLSYGWSHPCAYLAGPPAGFRVLPGVASVGWCVAPPVPVESYWIREYDLAVPGPVEPYTNQPITHFTYGPVPPPRTTAETAIATELDQPENKTLRDWLNHKLGSPGQEDPTGISPRNPYPIDLPTCLGATFAGCTQQLRDAGLTGTITRETLSQDDAIMEEGADRTTAIYPGGGVQSDTDVKVYVNPDPMPTMTPVETTVADQIEQNNPGVDVASKTIARHCVRSASAAAVAVFGVIPSACGSMPILVTGYDAAGPAVNDRLAILAHPQWFVLHRRPGKPNSGWYNQTDTCSETARNAAKLIMTQPECDEYPFWSTLQAQDGPFNDGNTPRLLLVPQKQNGKQGSVLGGMYTRCGIPETPDASVAGTPSPFREIIALPSAFLNVPIGRIAGRINTIGLCG